MDFANSIKKTAVFYVKFENNRIIKKYTPRQLGAWTKNELARMGPTFIKIGQFVSTRGDVFPKDIVEELKTLQDNVAPLPWDHLKPYVPVNIYDRIDEKPIASASIGQVHTASIGGKDVVIKIKRPNIDKQIKSDFEGVIAFIKVLKMFSKDRRLTEFDILFSEYYTLLQQEIDFIKEADNMEKFETMFKTTSWIKIPQVYKQYSDNNCITMEYVPSIRLDDFQRLKELNFNLTKIAEKLMECFLTQIMVNGKILLDMHPANACVTENGKLVLYDYGMILDIDDNIQKHFNQLMIAIYDRDVDAVASTIIEMGLITIKKENIPYLKKFLLMFLSYIETVDINDFKLSSFDNLNTTELPFVISSKFLLLLRGISIIEGNCKALDKNFNYRKTLDPYINKYLVDVNYMEKRAMTDLFSLRKAPNKIQEQEIEMEIMRLNMKQQTLEVAKKNKNKMTVLGIMLMHFGAVQQDVLYPIYVGLMAAVMLL
jgi:ubiquinone biosynthesis protein